MAYVRSPLSNTSTSLGPRKASNPSRAIETAEAWAGRAGSVTSMIWIPELPGVATMAYVRSPTPNTSTSSARRKVANPPEPSKTAETGTGRVGSVMSMIWTTSSSLFETVTMAYVRSPLSNTSTSSAPYRAVNPPEPSVTVETGTGRAGLVTSMIWTASSSPEATTMAYVRSPIPNTSTSAAPFKAVNPSESKIDETGLAGSVTSMICTPSSS